MATFKEIIEKLRTSLEHDTSILKDFTISKDKDKHYVWLSDHLDRIGILEAHYEIRIEKDNQILVTLDFEEGKKKERLRFYNSIQENLPDDIEWFEWQNAKSLKYKVHFDINSPTLIDDIKKALLYFEETKVSDKVRQIMKPINKNDTQNEIQNDDKKMPNFPLNQILYGSPGTGKTYHTINKALAIIENKQEEELEKDRNVLKKRFDTYVEAGQIVFTTFHQSMSYEDFIEGIKPKREGSDEQPTVTYTVESGIFKQICLAASKPNKATDNFEETYSNFINDLTEKESIELETPSKKKKFDIRVNSNKNCIATPRTPTATQMTITKSMIRSYLLEQKVDDWKPYTIPIAEYLRKNFPILIKAGEKLEKSYPLSIPTQKLDFETIFKAYYEEMRKRFAKVW